MGAIKNRQYKDAYI